MVAPIKTISRAQRLQEAQQRATRARSEAFVNYTVKVCGLRLKPITIETFNALDAFGSAFFSGGPVTFIDIVNFIWIHHPAFSDEARAEKARVSRHVWRYLHPRLSGLNDLVWFASTLPRFRWMRIFRRPQANALQDETVEEIRRLVREAVNDMPTGDDDGGEPMQFSFEAYILNLFHRQLGMSFAETRALPMKQLAEHYREIIHFMTKGKALLITREEVEIWREDLAAKTAVAQAELKAKAEAEAAKKGAKKRV